MRFTNKKTISPMGNIVRQIEEKSVGRGFLAPLGCFSHENGVIILKAGPEDEVEKRTPVAHSTFEPSYIRTSLRNDPIS